MACMQRMRIPSESMEPTIPKGSRIVVESLATDQSSLNRWDVVVFATPAVERLGERLGTAPFTQAEEGALRGAPAAAGQEAVVNSAATAYSSHHNVVRPHLFYVKRVVGLPGEQLQFKAGQLHVNGKPVDMPDHIRSSYSALLERSTEHQLADEIAVPRDSVYLLSDNLSFGQDSRHMGAVPIDFIVGRVDAVEN